MSAPILVAAAAGNGSSIPIDLGGHGGRVNYQVCFFGTISAGTSTLEVDIDGTGTTYAYLARITTTATSTFSIHIGEDVKLRVTNAGLTGTAGCILL